VQTDKAQFFPKVRCRKKILEGDKIREGGRREARREKPVNCHGWKIQEWLNRKGFFLLDRAGERLESNGGRKKEPVAAAEMIGPQGAPHNTKAAESRLKCARKKKGKREDGGLLWSSHATKCHRKEEGKARYAAV